MTWLHPRVCASLLALAAATAGESPVTFDGPNPHTDPRDGAVVLLQGGVVRWKDLRIVADAVRYLPPSTGSHSGGDLYATGSILVTQPGLRLECERLGLHTVAETGKAWKVKVLVEPEAVTAGKPGAAKPATTSDAVTGNRLHIAPKAETDGLRPAADRSLRIEAETADFARDRIVLHDCTADFGHGSVLGMIIPRITIWLQEEDHGRDFAPREKALQAEIKAIQARIATERRRVAAADARPAPGAAEELARLQAELDGKVSALEKLQREYFFEPGRSGFRRYVAAISATSPVTTFAEIPIFWLPYVYRDFRYWWPWSQAAAGTSQRQGTWIRYWAGSDLPTYAGWKTRIAVRGDNNTFSGPGYGAYGRWFHDRFGKGQAEWFEMPREVVTSTSGDGRDGIATRHARAVTVDHQVQFPGGALALQWDQLPAGDPRAPGDTTPPDERFRADYMRKNLNERPLARKGATASYGTSLGTVVVDAERNPYPDRPDTERWLGVQMSAPRTTLVGPVRLEADGWMESLHRDLEGSRADRLSYRTGLAATKWLGGIALDIDGGVRGVNYYNGVLRGSDRPNVEERHVAYGDAGVSLRMEGDFGEAGRPLTNTITPTVGVQVLGAGRGDPLPGYGFGDSRDTLDEDRRYLVTGASTSLATSRQLFSASATARWGLRREDRRWTDGSGTEQYGRGALADLSLFADGAPLKDVVVALSALYDHRPREWQNFDGSARWMVHERVVLRWRGSMIPVAIDGSRQWSQEPGLTLVGNRYRVDAHLTIRPNGAPLDSWYVGASRRMAEGDAMATYQVIRDPGARKADHRFGLGFSLGGGPADDPTAELPSPHSWTMY